MLFFFQLMSVRLWIVLYYRVKRECYAIPNTKKTCPGKFLCIIESNLTHSILLIILLNNLKMGSPIITHYTK